MVPTERPRRHASDRRPTLVHGPPTVVPTVVRHDVLTALDRRWEVRVTTIEAGAGFGKSIALGQALRANHAEPRGIDAWVSCRSGCDTPADLARAVWAAFGPPRSEGDDGAEPDLASAAAAVSPLDACLVLDDAELLPDGTCVEAINDLVRRGPANLHLVISGRRLPRLSLARLRAAGDLVELGEDDLRLSDSEVAALAEAIGSPPPTADLAGWPALVRLALSASAGAVADFVWEEVIDSLDDSQRRILVALGALGAAAPETVAEVAGVAVDPDSVAAHVPLVARVGEDLVAHDLWAPYVDRLLPPAEVGELSRRAMTALLARGDLAAAGDLAIAVGDEGARDRATIDLVRATLGSLPLEVADRWSAATPPGLARDLLTAAAAHARSVTDPPAAELDALVDGFRGRDDAAGESVALALATLAAEGRGDIGRLLALSGPARALSSRHPDPLLRLLVGAVDTAAASLTGDVSGGLAVLEGDLADLPMAARPEVLIRLHWHLLLLAGRAADAADVARAHHAHRAMPVTHELEAVARWFDGDPDGLPRSSVDIGPDRYVGLSERDRFDQAALITVLAASAADAGAIDLAIAALDRSALGDAPGDAAFLAAARAATRIVHHDEAEARDLIDGLVGAGPTDSVADTSLRRSLAIPYVVSTLLRERWDGADLGPSQVRTREIARTLVEARAGRRPSGPPSTGAVITALPLPWSVELAGWAVGWGESWGHALVADLAERYGDTVVDEVAVLAGTRGLPGRLARGVEAVAAALPRRPDGEVEVRVLGPLEVVHDGEASTAPPLRRGRVRELLCVLVVERTVTRDRVLDLLWPDFDLDRARPNLRVTLTHLQRLLEPQRGTGEPPYFLRADGEHLRLVAVEGLEVDLWRVEEHLAEADAARREGDAAARVAALRAAVDQWRGDPLPDLDGVARLAGIGQQVSRRLVDATLELGELELVEGDHAAAATRAARALAADGLDERAHRLAIAAALHRRDPVAVATATGDLHRALDELAVDAEPSTAMLLRQASALRPGPAIDLRDPGPRLPPAGRGVVGSRRR